MTAFLLRYLGHAWTIWVPLVLILLVVCSMLATGHKDGAVIVANGGTVLTLFGNAVYVLINIARGTRW